MGQKVRFSLMLLALVSTGVLADSIRTSDGISCSFNSDDTPFEITAYTEKDLADYDGQNSYYDDNTQSRIGLKFKYKFGGPKRLDCDKLYQMELRDKEARVRQLEEQIKAMEAVNSVDWDIFSK